MEDGIKNSPVCLLSEYSGSRIRFQYPNPSHSVEHPLKHNTCSYTQSRIAAFSKYFRVLLNTHTATSLMPTPQIVTKALEYSKPVTKENQQTGEGLGKGGYSKVRRLPLKCDGTRAETKFRLSAKQTSPFKMTGASFQSTTGSRGLGISGSNVGYTPCSEIV